MALIGSLAAGTANTNIGYIPVNKAGDNITGMLLVGTMQEKRGIRLLGGPNGSAMGIELVDGRSGAFTNIQVDIALNGPGGWCYHIRSGGTSSGRSQSGGGYTNGTNNFSHSTGAGSGWTVTSPSSDVIRFSGGNPGTHPCLYFQFTGSLSQVFDESSVNIIFS